MGDVKKRIPVACTLGPSAAVDQLVEWQTLHGLRLAVERIEHGVRMRWPLELRTVIEDLAEREQACCQFLTIEVTVDGSDAVMVDITSDQPEAVPVIELLAGIA